MSAPKTRTRTRWKPRRGPRPSPWRFAASTAAAQSASTPSRCGVTFQRFSPLKKVTGTFSSAAARRSRSFCAAAGVIPPTLTPAIVTPAGIFEGEPAKTAPKSAASASETATAAARICRSSRERARRLRALSTPFCALTANGARVAAPGKAFQNANSSIPPLTLSPTPVM